MSSRNPQQVRDPFPHTLDAFETDARVSYSKLDGKWILEDDADGSEWEWDEGVGKWVPSLDETLVEQQRAAYAVPGVDEQEDTAAEKKKRKKDGDDSGNAKRQKKSDHPKAERKNTAVYVTSLPLDVTAEDVTHVFSKCGVIAEEIDSGLPRVKLYTDETGAPKGDALIVYFRPESVQLAVQMLDDTDFRLGEPGPMGRMRVKEADFSYKKQKDAPAKNNTKEGNKDRTKIIRKTQKLNNKLADWDDDEPSTVGSNSTKWEKLVYLKHMFTLKELEEDAAAILDIKEDIRDECSKLGEVTNVILFDKEADGVASVRFSTPQAAAACIRVMNGRHFAGQRVEAKIADGTERYKKTSEKKVDLEGDEEGEESRRLDQFGAWLETEQGGEAATAAAAGGDSGV